MEVAGQMLKVGGHPAQVHISKPCPYLLTIITLSSRITEPENDSSTARGQWWNTDEP